jgi:hypothetical protein
MQTAISTISVMPSNKAELRTFTAKVKQEILSGSNDVLKVAGMLKAMEELIKELRADKEIKEAIESEAEKYNEKTIDFANFKLTKSQRPTYDYTVCGDDVYNTMIGDFERMKQSIKARESMLLTGFDPSTGEAFLPPKKESVSVISVSLK